MKRTLKIWDTTHRSLTACKQTCKDIACALAMYIIEGTSTLVEGCHNTRFLKLCVSFLGSPTLMMDGICSSS